ncbi:MAG: GNAT family N-acetyltransferase [Chloroflexi bacterium]|nr:GNAT family N-acetyltransferase [Chloroflexota bacterium]
MTVHAFKQGGYPLEVPLLDDTSVLVRPMAPEDAPGLLAFFQALPEEGRYYLREDLSSQEVAPWWAEDLDYSRALPLLAFVGGTIVGNGTLLRSRAPARQHVGEARIAVHPDYRNVGLGTVLLYQLMVLANEAELEILTFEAVAGKQDQAIRSAQWLGFTQVAQLRGVAKNQESGRHDVIVMEACLGEWFKWWPFRIAVSRVQVRFPW